jgi:hypothetical protein
VADDDDEQGAAEDEENGEDNVVSAVSFEVLVDSSIGALKLLIFPPVKVHNIEDCHDNEGREGYGAEDDECHIVEDVEHALPRIEEFAIGVGGFGVDINVEAGCNKDLQTTLNYESDVAIPVEISPPRLHLHLDVGEPIL